jgi:putative heme-binding domain-containing protein
MGRTDWTVRRLVTAVLAASLAMAVSSAARAQAPAQAPAQVNPLAGNARAIDGGKNIYRGRCGVCHGIDARGYRGSDLTTGDWVHGGSDAQLFTTISRGITGTEMPPHPNMSEEEVWMVIAYLRTLSAPGGPPVEQGDAGRGEQIFWAKDRGNCGQCHMVGARGGRVGPNLARIGASRSATVLAREVRTPEDVIPVGFETVTVVTRDGRKIRGARKNEDTFSVQIMTGTEDILSFFKNEVTEVIAEPERSLMPAYGPERISDADLTDLVRYLRSLRGTPTAQH